MIQRLGAAVVGLKSLADVCLEVGMWSGGALLDGESPDAYASSPGVGLECPNILRRLLSCTSNKRGIWSVGMPSMARQGGMPF